MHCSLTTGNCLFERLVRVAWFSYTGAKLKVQDKKYCAAIFSWCVNCEVVPIKVYMLACIYESSPFRALVYVGPLVDSYRVWSLLFCLNIALLAQIFEELILFNKGLIITLSMNNCLCNLDSN